MRILDQLRLMITELRSVPAPEGIGVSGVDGGPFYDCRLPSRLYWGPYATVREFHQALVDGMDLNTEYTVAPDQNDVASDLSELFEFYRRSGNELVLNPRRPEQPQYSGPRRRCRGNTGLGDGRMVPGILGVHLCETCQPSESILGRSG